MSQANANRKVVIVAVKDLHDGLRFAEKIRSFCRSEETDHYLVHVLDERAGIPTFYADMFGSFDLSELGAETFDRARREAWIQLRALKTNLGDPENMRLQILEKQDAAAAILSESVISQASMVALEIEDHLYKIMPQGLSVTLTLLEKSPVPVLVLKKQYPDPFEQAERVMLIADDLSENCLPAVRRGLQLAALWGRTRVVHMHVIEEKLHGIMESIRKIGHGIDLVKPESSDAEGYFQRKVDTALLRRSWDYLNSLQNSESTYETVVRVGSVANEVVQMVQDFQPTLSVFGRTPGFHPIGRLPFSTMLSECKAILVVP